MRRTIRSDILNMSREPFFKNTPYFYYYDLSDIEQKTTKIQKSLPNNVKCYYAIKANPHKKILEQISKKYYAGVEISSNGELLKASAFFKPKEIIYTGPGKTPYELEEAIKKDIRLLIVESFIELQRINELARKYKKVVNILLGVNVNFSVKSADSLMSGMPSKLRLDEAKIQEFIAFCKKAQNIRLLGLHSYIGTGIMNCADSIAHASYVFQLTKKIEEESEIRFNIINLGGGFGIDYSDQGKDFNLKLYGERLKSLLKKFNYKDKEIILELGRYIVAESGYYCTQVIDIKESKGETFVIVSGGLNHLNRPCITGENQPVIILPKKNELFSNMIKNKKINISGPLCLNDDFLGKNVYIKTVKIGDLLIICKAGAYGLSGSPNDLLSHKKPQEFFNV